MMGNGTREEDYGFKKFMDEMNKVESGPSVEVGFFSGSGGTPAADPAGPSIAEYMFINEFEAKDGARPARPVMAETADAQDTKIQSEIRKGAIRIAKGETTVEKVLTLIGVQYTGDLKKAIVAFSDPPNALSTQIKKGGSPDRPIDNPLFEGGTAMNAVTWKVE